MCFAEFAVFLLRMGQPFHEAVLMDIFDASTTFARIEKWFFCCPFAAAYTASVNI
jgi:hypothetical protein